jgi:predicted ATP-dependent endonuclease of OLD family
LKINSIEIKNFRSIKELEWDINNNRLEVLVGKNSVGKSAIIDALLYLNDNESRINSDDTPVDAPNEKTEISLIIHLSDEEYQVLDIDTTDYYSKNKITPSSRDKKKIKISKIFPVSNLAYFKINKIQLREYIFQDIQKMKEILKDSNLSTLLNSYTIFKRKKPIENPETLHKDLNSIRERIRKYKDKNDVNIKNENIEEIILFIEKINGYNERINDILPKFLRFNLESYGTFPDKVHYQEDTLKSGIIEHVFDLMTLDFNELIKYKGKEHIINTKVRERNKQLEYFLSENWFYPETNIEMKFHPQYMVCSIIDEFAQTKISQRSSGEIWLLSFLIFLCYYGKNNDNLVILSDEPSINLHPNAQRELIRLIEQIISKNNNLWYFYTTHTPYLIPKNKLDQISRVIKTNEKGTNIIKFEYSDLRDLISERLTDTTPTINTIKSRWSQFFNIWVREAFFVDGVILCEGYTERLSIPIWGEKEGFSLAENGLILVQTNSKCSMVDYAEFFHVFRIPYFLIFDNDKKETDDDNDNNDENDNIRDNRWLMKFAGGYLEDFPEGSGPKYFIFSPDYEKCIRNSDSDYETIESKVGEKWGTGGKKGIRGRYCAWEYKKRDLDTPPIIKNLIDSLRNFNNKIDKNADELFKLGKKKGLTIGKLY